MARYIVLPAVVLGLQDQTEYQIAIYFSFNGLFLFYIVFLKPFASLFLFILNIAIEFAILIAVGGALMLYSMQIKNQFIFNDIMFYGWMIYYANNVAILILILTYFIQIFLLLVEKARSCLSKKNKVQPIL